MQRALRTRLASLAVLLVVLGAGVVLGVAWERRGRAPASEAAVAEDDGGDRDRKRDGDRERRRLIVERVGLSPAQQTRVDSIIEIHRDRMRSLRREFREEYDPRYWSLVQDTRDALRSVLDSAQQARYDSLLAEHDRRRRDDDDDDEGRRRKRRDRPRD